MRPLDHGNRSTPPHDANAKHIHRTRDKPQMDAARTTIVFQYKKRRTFDSEDDEQEPSDNTDAAGATQKKGVRATLMNNLHSPTHKSTNKLDVNTQLALHLSLEQGSVVQTIHK